MTPPQMPAPHDLFVSYAHLDNQGPNRDKVAELLAAIKADYRRCTGRDLAVFFDADDIRSMDDWEARILRGLRHAKMMVAILSPAYFASDYCRKEWECYVETELAQALPGEGIAPIYVLQHPAFDDGRAEEHLRHWVRDLRRRQYIEWRDFWPEGAGALQRADARRRLAGLPGQIADRLRRAAVRDGAPNTVPLPSVHFVGRRDELHQLRQQLVRGHIGAITALHGLAGIGKSMLAFAYAWGYGSEYPGGRFLIPAADLADLGTGVMALAEAKGVALTDAERWQPAVALARVRAVFESGPPALLVVDNLEDARLLEPQRREQALPRGDHIHVLVTTRESPDALPRIHCLALDALEAADGLALLHSYRPAGDSPQDDEWKAGLDIVHRLGGHALALEVVGVFLREHPEVAYRAFHETLVRDGISLLQDEVGPDAHGRLAWHTESCIASLLEPTLRQLSPPELRALEYAAQLPPDSIALPWLHQLLAADFPDLSGPKLTDPIAAVLKRLERLRLVVPRSLERQRADSPQPQAGPTGNVLARMHRVVQAVVAERSSGSASQARAERVTRQALRRAEGFAGRWGKAGGSWECVALRDHGLLRLRQDDPLGVHVIQWIAEALQYLTSVAEAIGVLRESVRCGQRLAAADPGNAGWQRDLSVSHNKIGDVLGEQGDLGAALAAYRDGLAIRQRLAAADPGNAGWQRDLSVSHNKIGDVLGEQGDLGAALAAYRDGLAIAQRLAAADPGNAGWQRDLSVSQEKIGDVLGAQGDLGAALAAYRDGLAIAQRLAAADPGNAGWQRDLSVSHNKIGDVLRAQGDLGAALAAYRDGLAIRQRLAAADPGNAGWQRDLSVSHDRIGDVLRAQGDLGAALAAYRDGLAIAQRLAAADPGNAGWQRDLWVSYWRMATLSEQARPGEARDWWQKAHDVLAGMKRRRLFVSAQDEAVLAQIRNKLGPP